jgi:hypothetical protein
MYSFINWQFDDEHVFGRSCSDVRGIKVLTAWHSLILRRATQVPFRRWSVPICGRAKPTINQSWR